MIGSIRRALVMTLLVLVPALDRGLAQGNSDVRRPRGLYAEFLVGNILDEQQMLHPSITTAQLHAYLNGLYNSVLNNPAVSGLALGVRWKILNPNPPSSPQPYDWSYLDDAFSAVAMWNAQNPAHAPKTIQVQTGAGFNSPQWVLDQLPSCDSMFQIFPQTPPANCGKATFLGFTEGGGGVLPLPWNATYKALFKTFLMALAAQYLANPILVSLDFSGPTAASTEMILPDNNNTPAQFGNILPNNMWLQLLALDYPGMPAYQKSLQAIIDEWSTTIDMFGQIFSGITFVAWTGDGFPNLANTGFTVPSAFKNDCPVPNMDCAAETTILSHFVDPSVDTANAKATGEAGLKGRPPGPTPGNLGVYAARQLSQRTAQFTSPAAQILAGDQFATGVARLPVEEGCTAAFPPLPATPACSCVTDGCVPASCVPQACLAPGVTQADLAAYNQFSDIPAKDLISPEQGLYNVLKNYFDTTPAAASFGGTPGTAPSNYLQIYNDDFIYASAHVNAPAQVVETGGTTVSMSAQDLLNLASQKLLSISEPAPAITLVANAEGENRVIAPNTWVEIKGVNLGPVGFSRTWGGSDFANSNMPTQVNGVSATVNGKSAFIYYVSPEQVNILTPPDAMSGSVQVQVTNNGATSASFTAQAQALAPSFFVFNGGPYVAATHVNGSFLGPASLYPGATTPAQPGETIVLYANGFGPTSTPVVSGSASQSGTLSPLPVVNIGGAAATVTFAGLVSPGEFQFNVIVPPNTPNGDQPITATYNGATTQAGTLITVQN